MTNDSFPPILNRKMNGRYGAGRAIPSAKAEWLIHPDVGFDPSTATWITGPGLKVEYAKGSLEWGQQQKERT
jgi:hypothetical protein